MRYAPATSPRRGQADTGTDALARGLVWFSLALGAIETVAPRFLAERLGMEDKSSVIQAYGLREIANGAAILMSKDATPWIWTRVGGDGLDIATLLAGFHGDNPKKENVGIALAAVAGVTALDALCAHRLSSEAKSPPPPLRDYSDRSGFPAPAEQMRGLASDFEVPRDIRGPEELRSFTVAVVAAGVPAPDRLW